MPSFMDFDYQRNAEGLRFGPAVHVRSDNSTKIVNRAYLQMHSRRLKHVREYMLCRSIPERSRIRGLSKTFSEEKSEAKPLRLRNYCLQIIPRM